VDQWNLDDVGHADPVHLPEEFGLFVRIHLGRQLVQHLIHLRVLIARDVDARPVVGLARHFLRVIAPRPVERERIGRTIGVHLQVGVEVPVGIRIAGIGGEEDRGVDRLELDLETDLLQFGLDDLLGPLADGVDRGLVENLKRLPVVLADTITVGILRALPRPKAGLPFPG
jgi:hypothetical protein